MTNPPLSDTDMIRAAIVMLIWDLSEHKHPVTPDYVKGFTTASVSILNLQVQTLRKGNTP